VAGQTGTAAEPPARSKSVIQKTTGMKPANKLSKSKRSEVASECTGDPSGAGVEAQASNGSGPATSIGGALLTAPTHSSSILHHHTPCLHLDVTGDAVTAETIAAEASSDRTVPPDHGTRTFSSVPGSPKSAHSGPAPLSFAAHATSLTASGFVCT
jgi:hypothetical protein